LNLSIAFFLNQNVEVAFEVLLAILTIQFEQSIGEDEALILMAIVPLALFIAAVVKVAYPEPSPTMKPPKTSKSSFGPLP
jgi:hypothetical protein